jgi:hypothetical protein
MSEVPARRDVKTTHFPSREKLALASNSASGSSGLALSPLASAMKMSLLMGAKLAGQGQAARERSH